MTSIDDITFLTGSTFPELWHVRLWRPWARSNEGPRENGTDLTSFTRSAACQTVCQPCSPGFRLTFAWSTP